MFDERLTPRQRVRAALERRPVDRVPIFMWLHPETHARVAELLAIPAEAVDPVLGNDVRQIWVANNYAMEGIVHQHDGEGHVDAWGVHWERRGGFNQMTRHPLAGADEVALDAYRFPDPVEHDLLAPLRNLVAHRGEFYIGSDVSPCIFELHARLRGLEDACLDLAEAGPEVERLLDACADHSVQLARLSLDPAFDIDWLWTGDDVAGQRGMMMSPATWRELIKPRLARVVAEGVRAGLPVPYHSCGGVRPIIEDLIEIGVSVLNPVQGNCPGMDPLELKREYGDRLAFMGGVDTQDLLVNATALEVRREAERLIEGMTAGGGGYILAASHTIAPETPTENIFALYAAAGLPEDALRRRAAAWRDSHHPS